MPKMSRAQAQRLAAEYRELTETPPALPPAHREILDAYRPKTVVDTDWIAVAPVFRDVITRARIGGTESFKKHLGVVASLLLWRHARHLPIGIRDAFSFAAIDDYFLNGLDQMEPATRNDYRSRLQKVALKINPGIDAPRAAGVGHVSVRPGYSTAEEALIRRAALRQRRESARRALCAVVGWCAGAGLDSVDLRDFRANAVDDRGANGIHAEVHGPRPRHVVVRRDYEDLVRIGLAGLRPNDLIIGKNVGRSNIVGKVVEKADLFDDIPRIEASRLRSTWLVWLMTRQVPVKVILDAAGLRSARTLTDLLAYISDDATDPAADAYLRHGGSA